MQKTNISWSDFTANPLIAIDRATGKRGWACTKVSPGCSGCYAETLNLRWGTKAPFTPEGNQTVDWRLHAPELQTIAKGQPGSKVFIGDMTDLYHDAVPDAWLDDIFAAVWNAHHTIHQTLTKRPRRMHAYWTAPGRAEAIAMAAHRQWMAGKRPTAAGLDMDHFIDELQLPLPNLWHGVSVENQRLANVRIPCLLETPAAVRFLSCEPLLEDIDLRGDGPIHWPLGPMRHQTIHWVIVGGESGPHRRHMQLEWLESIINQCHGAGAACWVKQASGLRPGMQGNIPDTLWNIKQFPGDARPSAVVGEHA